MENMELPFYKISMCVFVVYVFGSLVVHARPLGMKEAHEHMNSITIYEMPNISTITMISETNTEVLTWVIFKPGKYCIHECEFNIKGPIPHKIWLMEDGKQCSILADNHTNGISKSFIRARPSASECSEYSKDRFHSESIYPQLKKIVHHEKIFIIITIAFIIIILILLISYNYM